MHNSSYGSQSLKTEKKDILHVNVPPTPHRGNQSQE